MLQHLQSLFYFDESKVPLKYQQFMRFALVGAIGFLVDFGTLKGLAALGLPLLAARLLSFLVAATYSWQVNKHFTFQDKDANLFQQWLRFILANLPGMLINLASSTLLISPLVGAAPILAVAIGSLSGMMFNFTLSRKFVFKSAPKQNAEVTPAPLSQG